MRVEWLERARRKGTPLIEDGRAIFIWQGVEPVGLIGDFNHWSVEAENPMDQVEDGVWAQEIELPRDAYVEYVFIADSEQVLDPLNRQHVSNGLGKQNNYFYMPGAAPASELAGISGRLAGRLEHFDIATHGNVSGRTRRVTLYAPPVDEPVALLVAYDGQDYLRSARLAWIVEAMMEQGRIPPLAIAFIENGGWARTLEYACAEAPLKFLCDQVLSTAYEHLNLLDIDSAPGVFGVLGASMSGLTALYTGLRLPQIFGRVLAQSGAYTLEGYEFVVWNLVKHSSPDLTKVWLDAGNMEHLVDCNRQMAALLAERGFATQYHEYSGGHNYTVWRNDLPAGLEFLFGIQE